MPANSHWSRISCPNCAASSLCGPEEMLRRLQTLGMLRRQKDPDWDLVSELFRSATARLMCSECGHLGLSLGAADDGWDDDDWEVSRNCDRCGKAIPPERLEAFPDAQRCVSCQQSSERGEDDSQPEYCPRCGTPMTTRQRSGTGLAGYEMFCPECRR